MKSNLHRPATLLLAGLATLALSGGAAAQTLAAEEKTAPDAARVLFTVELEPTSENEAPIKMWVDRLADGTNSFRGEWAEVSNGLSQIDISADLGTGKFTAVFVEPDQAWVAANAIAQPVDVNPREVPGDMDGMDPVSRLFGGVTGYTHTVHARAKNIFGTVQANTSATLNWCWDSDTGCQLPHSRGGHCATIHGEWSIDSCTSTFSNQSSSLQRQTFTASGTYREIGGGGTGPGDLIVAWAGITADGTNSFISWDVQTTSIFLFASVLNGGKKIGSCS